MLQIRLRIRVPFARLIWTRNVLGKRDFSNLNPEIFPMKLNRPSLIKTGHKTLLLSMMLLAGVAHAQAFTEDFGTDPGRVSNANVPGGNFTFKATGTVEDGQYTVMPPQNVISSTGSSYWTNLPEDHTGGGALMVLNAGPSLNEFYQRDFEVQPGHSYRVSAWRYVVNGSGAGLNNPISWSLQIRNTDTNETQVESGPLPSSARNEWIESVYEFTVPVDCKVGTAGVPARLALTNRSAVTSGNDFYIDDISVADITPNDALDPFCPLPQADLSITKTSNAASLTRNGQVVYTIIASNAGPDEAAGVAINDSLPSALLDATWVCTGSSGGVCTASGSGAITDTVTLPAGATVTYTLTATVSSTATGTVTNSVTVTPPEGLFDPTAGNNTASSSSPVIVPGAAAPTPVPTLGGIGLLLLSGVVAGSMVLLRRRKSI